MPRLRHAAGPGPGAELEGAVDIFGSAEGSLGAAIAALLVVLGYRFARPSSARGALGLVAYIAAVAIVFLRERGVIAGPPVAAGVALRIVGAVLLVVGLVVAGSASRRRSGPGRTTRPAHAQRSTWVGLAIVLVGFLARAPSTAGGIAVVVAVGCAVLAVSAADTAAG